MSFTKEDNWKQDLITAIYKNDLSKIEIILSKNIAERLTTSLKKGETFPTAFQLACSLGTTHVESGICIYKIANKNKKDVVDDFALYLAFISWSLTKYVKCIHEFNHFYKCSNHDFCKHYESDFLKIKENFPKLFPVYDSGAEEYNNDFKMPEEKKKSTSTNNRLFSLINNGLLSIFKKKRKEEKKKSTSTNNGLSSFFKKKGVEVVEKPKVTKIKDFGKYEVELTDMSFSGENKNINTDEKEEKKPKKFTKL